MRLRYLIGQFEMKLNFFLKNINFLLTRRNKFFFFVSKRLKLESKINYNS